MQNKFFGSKLNTLLLFALIVLAIVAITMRSKEEAAEEISELTVVETKEVENYNWQENIADVRASLNIAFPSWGDTGEYVTVERDNPISIQSTGDVTGDGVDEALVYVGTGGATMIDLALMRLVDQKPVVSKFKEKTGKIEALTFSSGGGGSGRYGGGVKLNEDNNSVVVTFMNVYGEPSDSCDASVYVWNSKTEVFEYNAVLSAGETQKLLTACQSIAKETGVKFQGKE